MKREVQLGTCKKYHSIYLGLKKKLLWTAGIWVFRADRLPVSLQSGKQIEIKSNDSKH